MVALKRMMRNTVLSSKHTEELGSGRETVGQKSKSKIYGEMQDSQNVSILSRGLRGEAESVKW